MDTITDTNTIEAALVAISDRDGDHARVQNGVGFNGRDTEFGNSLADQVRAGRNLTAKQRFFAYRMLRTYKGQLAGYGITYDDIRAEVDPRTVTTPTVAPTFADDISAPGRKVIISEGRIAVEFPYDPSLVRAIKEVDPARKWMGDIKQWWFPLTAQTAVAIRAFLTAHPTFDLEDKDGLLAHLAEVGARNVVASSALDAELVIPGFGRPDFQPRGFQRAGIRYALDNPHCIIADEMGLGKTIQALGVIKAKDAFPALVVVPKIAWQNWGREAWRALPGHSIGLLGGMKKKTAHRMAAGGRNIEPCDVTEALAADVVIISYDVMSAWAAVFPKGRMSDQVRDEVLAKAREANTVLLNDQDFRAVILDESHYIKNASARRTRAIRGIAGGSHGHGVPAVVRLLLTGTPIMNRPEELMTQLQVLDRIDDFGGFWNFLRRYVETDAHLVELHTKLRASCFVRRVKADVMPELPAVQAEVVPVPLANRARYDAVLDDLMVWMKERMESDVDFNRYLDTLPDDKARSAAKHDRLFSDAGKAYGNARALVRFNALKQVAADEKLPAVMAWIDNFLESTTDPATGLGEKLIVFTDHLHIGKALSERYGCDWVAGGKSNAYRKAAEDRFQSDPEARIIVLSIMAASVAITLTAASNACFVEFPWRPGDIDQAEGRAYGRVNDPHGLNSYYLAAPDTIDEDVVAIIDDKRIVVDAVTDGIGNTCQMCDEPKSAHAAAGGYIDDHPFEGDPRNKSILAALLKRMEQRVKEADAV